MLEKKTYNLYCGNEQIGHFNSDQFHIEEA